MPTELGVEASFTPGRGRIIFTGTPADLQYATDSFTGQYLRRDLIGHLTT